MSAQPAAVGPLDVARARRLTKQLREALSVAVDLLGQAFDGRAWEALGYASWEQYCTTELPELAILGKGMPTAERRATVAALRTGRSMSLRAIGKPLGLSAQTVQRDLEAAGVQLATVTSLDGRQRPAAAAQPAVRRPRVKRTDRVVELLAGSGAEGMNVRDVARALRWSQHITSATLTRLAEAGRITYVRPVRRGLFGTYVAAS